MQVPLQDLIGPPPPPTRQGLVGGMQLDPHCLKPLPQAQAPDEQTAPVQQSKSTLQKLRGPGGVQVAASAGTVLETAIAAAPAISPRSRERRFLVVARSRMTESNRVPSISILQPG